MLDGLDDCGWPQVAINDLESSSTTNLGVF
jgi:hypothetical protein